MQLEPLEPQALAALYACMREVSYERPDPERTEVRGAALAILPEYMLVEFLLHPQTTIHTTRPGTQLASPRRSSFLYNPAAVHPSRRLIHLAPEPGWLDRIHDFVQLRIDSETAVAYTEYFAHLLDEDFLPITRSEDAPFRAGATESQTAAVTTLLDANLPPATTTDHSRLPVFEDIISFDIPAISDDQLHRTSVQVSERGLVRWNHRQQLYQDNVFNIPQKPPTFIFELKHMYWRSPRTTALVNAHRAFMILSVPIKLLAWFAFFNTLFAVLFDAENSYGVRDLFIWRHWDSVYTITFFGVIIYFAIEFIVSVRDGFRWRAEERGPGRLSIAYEAMRDDVRSWKVFQGNIWRGMASYLIGGLMTLIGCWSFIVFWGQNQYVLYFRSTELASHWSTLQYVVLKLIDPYTFWLFSSDAYFAPPFGEAATFWGRLLPWIIPLSAGVILYKTVHRYFLLVRGGDD